jgi:hypothetical protein
VEKESPELTENEHCHDIDGDPVENLVVTSRENLQKKAVRPENLQTVSGNPTL